MKTITFQYIEIDARGAVFNADADISEFAPEDIQTWEFDSKPVSTGSLIRTIDGVSVPTTSRAFGLAYNAAFAAEHCARVSGPGVSQESPDAAFFDSGTVPVNVLAAYVNRVDPTRPVTQEELDRKKRPKATPATGSAAIA